MKVDSKIYKGIAYVQLTELPQMQQEKFLGTPDHRHLFIKIMIDGKIISQCLQYKDYSNWYDTVYQVSAAPVKEPVSSESLEIKPNLALNKF